MQKKELQKQLNNFIEQHELQEYAKNTLIQYKHGVQKFIDYLGKNCSLTKRRMLEYKDYLDKISRSTQSKNNWIVIVNKFVKFIGRDDLVLKKFHTQKKYAIKEMITVTDYKRLLRHAKRMDKKQVYMVMIILAKTGIRISELRYFTVENLNRENLIEGALIIKNKGKERDISIRKDLIIEIRKYCRENKIKSGTIFPSSKKPNQMTCVSTFWKQMKRVAGAARVRKSKVHAHSFRHLFATVFLEKYPGNTPQLSDFLGHNNVESTRIYTQLTLSAKRKMLDEMDFNK